MRPLNSIWKKITCTDALKNSSGIFETAFFETVYRISYIIGISSSDNGVPYLIYSIFVNSLITLLMCGVIWYTCTEASDLDEIASSSSIITLQFITMYRFINMKYYKDMYKKLAMSMESPYFDTSTVKRKEIVDYWVKMNSRYLKLLLSLGHCTLTAWFLYPLIDDLEYNLFLEIRLPFNYRSPSSYVFAYFLVGIAFVYISHFVMVIDLIMQAHLLHLVCQLAVLRDCIENAFEECAEGFGDQDLDTFVTDDRFRSVCKKRFGDLVYQHRTILSHIMVLRYTLSGPMLGQLTASGILICFVGYQATTTGPENVTKCIMSMFFLSYNLLKFYIVCRWCEEITMQSHGIGDAAYFSKWECGMANIPEIKSSLLLIKLRANKPLVLTAGGLYDLSLLSYSSLLKTSYSALTVLLRLKQ